MNAKTDFTLSFDPEAWEYSVVSYTPRSWLPLVDSVRASGQSARMADARRSRSVVHRAGRVGRRELDR